MNKIITTDEAKIRTASVEIKTLTINGRKVTQSLFRQMPVEDIICRDSCTLKGVPWGWINYLTERPGDINLVWQSGNELRRCLLNMRDYCVSQQDLYTEHVLVNRLYGEIEDIKNMPFHRAVDYIEGNLAGNLEKIKDRTQVAAWLFDQSQGIVVRYGKDSEKLERKIRDRDNFSGNQITRFQDTLSGIQKRCKQELDRVLDQAQKNQIMHITSKAEAVWLNLSKLESLAAGLMTLDQLFIAA